MVPRVPHTALLALLTVFLSAGLAGTALAQPPTFSSALNTSPDFRVNQDFTASITINDETALSAYVFSTDLTGTWQNDSPVSISGTQYLASETKAITRPKGTDICWRYYANDTDDNVSGSNTHCFGVRNTPPTHSTPLLNTTTIFKKASDDLYCWNRSTADADGDPVTNLIIWYRNGIEQSALENQTQVSHTHTAVGDRWICHVTPYDTEEKGVTLPSDVVIIQPLLREGMLIIRLTLPFNENMVYIPGTGERSARGTGTWHNLPAWFIASYGSGALYGLVRYLGTPVMVSQSFTPTEHTIHMATAVRDSRVFLVSSKGNWQGMARVMPLISGFLFMDKPTPTFGFGLGLNYPIKIALEHAAITLQNSMSILGGEHDITITSQSTRHQKAVKIEKEWL